MRLLGIDYGEKRIGLALSDAMGDFAYPHSVIENTPRAAQLIKEISSKEGVGVIIIGDSRNYQGKENAIMKKVHEFKEELGKITGLPVHLEPELLTTLEAERIQGKSAHIDASAAAIILRSYIARTSHSRS